MRDGEYPLGWMGIRDEVASVIVFLCSVHDLLVSGGHVEVDSGRDI
jgi:NAD(P)-dependent dehydrogenase (short-subunit alcohol dehydrogenase family)